MKRLLCAVASVLVVAGVSRAGEIAVAHLSTTVLTNSATLQISNMSTSDAVYNGCLDYIVLDLGGYATPTVRVDVVTVANDVTGPSRTLFSLTAATADGTYPIRQKATSTTGAAATDAYEYIPLYQDKLVLHAYNAQATNAISVNAYIFVKEP
jgi:hypothetical protein